MRGVEERQDTAGRPAIVVPTYRRPVAFAELCQAIAAYGPSEAQRVAVIQDEETVTPADWTVVRMEPGYPGPRRAAGAAAAPDACCYLFLDDDHLLLPTFAKAWPALHAEVHQRDGLCALPLRVWRNRSTPRIVAMTGGMLLTRTTYTISGGWGEDYLDDIELALRVRWAGQPIWRWPDVITRHRYGIPGGFYALPGVGERRGAAGRLSRLDERYPGGLVRDPRSWWGFREVRRPVLGRQGEVVSCPV